MRQTYDEFKARNAEIIAIGPDGPNAFKRYWAESHIPFIGAADIRSRVADLFYQEVNFLKAGRMPAVLIIDLAGNIVYSHYGDSMADIPPNEELYEVLDNMEKEEHYQNIRGNLS